MSQYVRLEKIGQGAWSTVYKGLDRMSGEVVAIKQLVPEAGVPRREVELARKITHKNVCRTYALYQEDDGGPYCIAMEYLGGGTLRDVIQSSGPLSIDGAISIAMQILDGLEAAHQHIIHRDLKPENILLTADGIAKITDFGLAREIGKKPSLQSRRVVGTPDYWPPEQAMGEQCDQRSDIFAFGKILSELLTGREVPDYLASVIKRCTQFDPNKRYASVAEVREPMTLRGLQPAPRLTWWLVASLVILLLVSVPYWNRFRNTSPPGRGRRDSQRADAPGEGNKTAEVLRPSPYPLPKGEGIQRIAITDFQNLTGDKSLDPYTVGISETLSTELGRVRGLTLVQRDRAEGVIEGSFQRVGDQVRLTARVAGVEGSLIGTPALVDGQFKDLFRLQAELAKQLAVALGRKAEDRNLMATGPSLQAFESFSDGLYFLRNDMAADALGKFDVTLSLDPTYSGAYHYRGVALAKLNRLDEAIDSFKRALPRSEPERLVLWKWDQSFGPQHGMIRGMDMIQSHIQRDFFENRKFVALQRRVVYGEHGEDGTTILHFPDLEEHVVRRVEIRDSNIAFDIPAKANDSFIVLNSLDRSQGPLPPTIGFYAFSADAARLWHKEISDYGHDLPRTWLAGTTFSIYMPGALRWDLLDARSGDLLWRRENVPIDGFEPPMLRHTKAYGDVFIIKSQNIYHAIRVSDGSDAWTVPVQSDKASELADDSHLIVFEAERRIIMVNLETGKTVSEVNIQQYVDALVLQIGSKNLVGAVIQDKTLYVMSKDLVVHAISIGSKSRILWKTPIDKKMQSMRAQGKYLYLGTDTGELITMNVANGAIRNTAKVSTTDVAIDSADDTAVVVGSNDKVFGLSVDGLKKWEYAGVNPLMEAVTFNGVITVYNSPFQMTALDVVTGKELWKVAGARPPLMYLHDGRFFVLEENGVKEYSIRRPAAAITEKDTFVELSKAYQAKGDTEQSRVFFAKALEIDPNLALAGNDLKRDYTLIWEKAGPNIAGDPVLIDKRLVSVGRKVAPQVAVAAVNPETGAGIWRYSAERYAASVASGNALWYVTSLLGDDTGVTLYRIDIHTGDRKQIASWKRPSRVDQGWIAVDSGKVFVGTASISIDKSTLQAAVDTFDAASGARLSEKMNSKKANLDELNRPGELLMSMGFPSNPTARQ